MAKGEIRGMDELKQAFKDLGVKFGRNAITGVAVAQISYLGDVQDVAPYKTGDYRRSLHASVPEQKGNIIVGYVGTKLEYGPRLEYGFAGTDSLGRTFNQTARPHFRPTLDKNRNKYIQKIKEKLVQ